MEMMENLSVFNAVVMREACDVMDRAKLEILRLRKDKEELLEAAKEYILAKKLYQNDAARDAMKNLEAAIRRAEGVRS